MDSCLSRPVLYPGGGGIFGSLGRVIVRWPWLVIAVWLALALAVSAVVPSVNEMAIRHPVQVLPRDAPSAVAAEEMAHAFPDAGSDNLLLVLLTDDKGLGPEDLEVYRKLVERLRGETSDVQMVQDFSTNPILRETLSSTDGKAWILPLGLAGELGTPMANDAYLRVSAIVDDTVEGSGLTAHFAGPAASVADLTAAGESDRLPIELAIASLLLAILVVIYRNPVTMLLPLITIGTTLIVAQGVIAATSLFTGMPIANQSIVLLTAMMAGAGTDYAVFLISRYHDFVRRGGDSDDAVREALVSIGRVIGASAATVGVTFLGMGFAKLGGFSATGPALAIGIAVGFAGAITLLPAIMVLAGRRGWISPRAELAAQFWRRVGIRVVRSPRRYLVVSLVILVGLAACAGLAQFNYDERKVLPASMPSSRGYAVLERHFAANQMIPLYLVVSSLQDLRYPQALADLDQMAERVSQLPGVFAVRGLTRPEGSTLQDARATYQAGQVGVQLGEASELIAGRSTDLDRLRLGTEELATTLADVRGRVTQVVGAVSGVVDSLGNLENLVGGSQAFADIDALARMAVAIRALGTAVEENLGGLAFSLDWIDPVVTALDNSFYCEGNPLCVAARGEFQRLQQARDAGALERINEVGRQIAAMQGTSDIASTARKLSGTLDALVMSLRSLGVTDADSARRELIAIQSGSGELADASRQIADGVELLVDEVVRMGSGLTEASRFLVEMGRNASTPAMAGFNVPSQILQSDQFRRAAKAFVSEDGTKVRFLIQTDLNPFSAGAFGQVDEILAAARGAQPNTSLSVAKVFITGYPVTLRDTRDFYNRDLLLIMFMTIAVVLLILMLLLRSVVAPLYLVGSVVLSYLSAIGLGVLVFQVFLDQELHWSVPGLAFVVLVAVGADYNMLLASRLRDEAPNGIRRGVIRTVCSTGGVITAAGVIFAASMFGLLFSSISTIVQGGFVLGIGILLDTFVVRTVTVPALATILGRKAWWPSSIPDDRLAVKSASSVSPRE